MTNDRGRLFSVGADAPEFKGMTSMWKDIGVLLFSHQAICRESSSRRRIRSSVGG